VHRALLDEQQLRRDDVDRQQPCRPEAERGVHRAIIEHSPLASRARRRRPIGQLQPDLETVLGLSDETVIRTSSSTGRAGDENDESILAGWRTAVQRIYAEGGTLYIPEVQLSSRHPAGSQWRRCILRVRDQRARSSA